MCFGILDDQIKGKNYKSHWICIFLFHTGSTWCFWWVSPKLTRRIVHCILSCFWRPEWQVFRRNEANTAYREKLRRLNILQANFLTYSFKWNHFQHWMEVSLNFNSHNANKQPQFNKEMHWLFALTTPCLLCRIFIDEAFSLS